MKTKNGILLSIFSLCSALLFSCSNQNKADLVIYGNIFTSNEKNESVEALAIKDNKFIYVGNKKGVNKYVDENTKIEEYDSSNLISYALFDGHTHVQTLMVGQENSLGQISYGADKETCIKEIKAYIDANPNLDFYILSGWELQNFSNEEYGCPTASMIDDLTTKPILAYSSDGHSYWVNTALMNLANVTKDTICPDGGQIVKDNNGDPVGVFKDTAQYVIDNVKPEKTKEVYNKGILSADKLCLEKGYVYRFQAMDNEAFNSWKYPEITYMEEMDKNNLLTGYSQGSFMINNTDDALELVDKAISLRDSTKGGNFEITNVKIFLDGIIENAGAYLSEEYNSEFVGVKNYFGTQRWKGEDALIKMGHIIAKANKANMSVHFHGMGDQAISDILTAIEYAANEVGLDTIKNARNAIAHLALVKESDYVRFNKLNVISVFNPWSNKDPGYYDLQVSLLGKERADKQYPMKSFIKNNVNYSFGTDLGASFTYDSIECFHALTTRMYNNDDPASLLKEEEKLSRIETLRAMTIGGAYQLKMEDYSGSIEVGKDASLCLFSKDLLKINDNEIMSTEVLNSMYKGNWCK